MNFPSSGSWSKQRYAIINCRFRPSSWQKWVRGSLQSRTAQRGLRLLPQCMEEPSSAQKAPERLCSQPPLHPELHKHNSHLKKKKLKYNYSPSPFLSFLQTYLSCPATASRFMVTFSLIGIITSTCISMDITRWLHLLCHVCVWVRDDRLILDSLWKASSLERISSPGSAFLGHLLSLFV